MEDGSLEEVLEGNGDGGCTGPGIAGGDDLELAGLVLRDRWYTTHFVSSIER